MAISFISTGTADTGIAVYDPTYPAGVVAGDGLVLFVANKYQGAPPTIPAGWTLLGRYTGGQGANGIDAGVLGVAAYFREATGGEAGVQSVSAPGANSGAAVIHRYLKDPNKDWEVAIAGGSDNTAGVTWLIVSDVDPGVTGGDVLVIADGINADLIGFVSHALTIPGVTFGSIVVGRASQSWTDGDDGRLATHDVQVVAGPSTGLINWTFDRPGPLANAPAGASLFVRLREVDPPEPEPEPEEVVVPRAGRQVAIRSVGRMSPIRTGIELVDRAQDAVVKALNKLLESPIAEAIAIEVTLAPGLNKVNHGLKRPIRHFLWETNADVAIANRQSLNPQPDRTLWVEIGGEVNVKAFLLLLPGAA